jgi:hypothetical protein
MKNLLIEERHLRQRKAELISQAYEALFTANEAGGFSEQGREQHKALEGEIEKINEQLASKMFEDSPAVFEIGATLLAI